MVRVRSTCDSGPPPRRQILLLTAVAAWAIAAGVSVATLFVSDPHPGQLPGSMSLRGLDAAGPLHGIEAIILAPLIALAIARPLIRRVTLDGRGVTAAAVALFAGDWLLFIDPYNTILIIAGPPIVAVIAYVFFFRQPTIRFPVPTHSLRARVIYPFLALAIGIALMPPTPPRVNLFEDGHSLMPAAEMLHGKAPYRDIVPGHGLLSDGLLDFVIIKCGASNVGAVLRARAFVAALLPLAVYIAALGVTGSAEGALFALLLATCVTITGTPWARPVSTLEALPPIRAIPSFLALGAAAAAARLRSRRWLVVSGTLCVLAWFTSVEFGTYALIASAVAAFRSSREWRGKWRGLAALGTGLAASAIVPLIALAIMGALGAFLRVTLVEIPQLLDAYSIGYFTFPPGYEHLGGFPEIAGALFAPRLMWLMSWLLVLLGTCVAMAAPVRRRAADPIIVAGCWTIAAALSFAERTNVYFLPGVLVVAAACVVRLLRNGHRRAALVMIVALVVIAAPTARVMRGRPAADRDLVRYDALPRARGGVFNRDNAARLAATQTFINGALKPGETFFDFANMPMLYYLFDRRAPVRQYETPFYESEELQREVIERLEGDRSVRAALMQFPNEGVTSIDGVPNAVRAPLVYRYLVQHFQPAYERNGVVFWIRR